MEFREMAAEMSDKEVEFVLHLIYPFGRVEKIIRNYDSNSISVQYSLLKEKYKLIRKINFLPDDVYLITHNDPSDETRMEDVKI